MQIGRSLAIRNPVRMVSAVLYIASIFLPAFGEPDTTGTLLWWKGYGVLAMGWLGLFDWQYAWLGNLVIVLALIRPSRALSALLLFCAISALAWHELPTDATTKYIRDFGPGYYAWLLALLGAATVPFLGVPLTIPSAKNLLNKRPFIRGTSLFGGAASATPRHNPKVRGGPLSRWQVTITNDCIVALDAARNKREIALDSLDGVVIETTDEGPYRADIWWLLYGRDGKLACAFPQGAHGETTVVDKLMSLPGFDYRAMIDAETSVQNAIFPVWRKARDEEPSE